ncbi:MAG: DUF3127 domain-containing protein [Clostridia bacterium]|nr:DUF3127 domain-containing protein [Clostridia bacterium]
MEQIVKLTGRIAEVFPAQSGTSQRTGNQWMSQDYLFEFFTWSGAQNPNRLVVRIFGEDNIKRHNLQQYEDNVTLTLRLDASKTKEGDRWFNEVRVTNVERVGQQQPAQAPNVQHPTNSPQPQNNAPTGGENQKGGADDLPF